MTSPTEIHYVLINITEDGLAHLEASDKRMLCIQAEWLPSNTESGATFAVSYMKSEDIASVTFRISLEMSEFAA